MQFWHVGLWPSHLSFFCLQVMHASIVRSPILGRFAMCVDERGGAISTTV